MAVECTYCEEKINAKQGVYVRCSSCQDINLCLDCFSAGAEIAEHVSDHPYELVDCGTFHIIDETWRAHEELALLEAIELYGLGSWHDVANAVGSRTAEECRKRYQTVYVENFFGRRTWGAVDESNYNILDHTCRDEQPLSPSFSKPAKDKIVDISRDQQIRLGYMPRRDDYEFEFDNEAEFLISKLPVNAYDDTDAEKRLKLGHINLYRERLRERFRIKRVALEYNLVKLFFHLHPEDTNELNVKSNDIDQAISPNPSYLLQSTSDMTHLVEDAAHDALTTRDKTSDGSHSSDAKTPNKDLASREKIAPQHQTTILNYFRRVEPSEKTTSASTSTNTSDGTNRSSHKTSTNDNSILSSFFSDLNKSIAEQDFNTMEKKLRIFCQFSTAEEHSTLIRDLAREKELKMQIKDLIRKRKNGCRFHTQSPASSPIHDQTEDESSNASKRTVVDSKKSVTGEPMEVDNPTLNHNTPSKVTQRKSSNKNNESKAIMNTHSNQNSEPSWRLLSESEKRLCKASKLKPSQYISFKANMIKVSLHDNPQHLYIQSYYDLLLTVSLNVTGT